MLSEWNTKRKVALSIIVLCLTGIAAFVLFFAIPESGGNSECEDPELKASVNCRIGARAGHNTETGGGGGGGAPPMSAEQLIQRVSEQINRLVEGSAAIHSPKSVTRGESFQVHLDIAPAKLEQLLRDKTRVKSRIAFDRAKLTPVMAARLTGIGFEINPKDAVEQAISGATITSWSWQAKATDSGMRKLTIKLAGTIEIEGKSLPREFYEYTKEVEVSVGIRGFVEQYWQWLATSIALPIAAWAWTLFKRPKIGVAPSPSKRSRRRQ